MNNLISSSNSNLSQETRKWFEDFIANLTNTVDTLKVHQLQLETGTANKEVVDLYKFLVTASEEDIAKQARDIASIPLIKAIILSFVESLFERKSIPKKLAVDFSDSKVSVWAEIDDNNEILEKNIILAEAKANAKHQNSGFHITTTIVENSDKLSVPPHYKTII